MADAFNLDKYNCTPLPPRFWRVIHKGSQSKPEMGTGDLVARDKIRMISSELDLQEAVREHLTWKTRRKSSCFMSVFSDGDHAFHWAISIAMHRYPKEFEYDIIEIDTAKLPPGTRVLHAASLVNTLPVKLDCRPPKEDEYLILHRIPHEAILNPTESTELMP
ncbi:hypothetical protein V8C44DRAFT_330983 [Trichoderma aethiopicum]